MKLTKQGVRDLSDLKGKSKGKVLDTPPVAVDCKHRNKEERLYFTRCLDCGETFDIDWH